jgi:hypothetical protein
MSWSTHHTNSERLATAAEVALRGGERARAVELYTEAARAEQAALNDLDKSKLRTVGITAVSAIALFYKAGQYDAASQLAYQTLSSVNLPGFAVQQLQELLTLVWSRQETNSPTTRFIEGDVLVSVKGGEIVRGGAPLNLIVRKVEEVQAFFYRTVELLLGQPLRRRGEPSREIQEYFRPWLFQAPAGSYQFAVRVQEPAQADLFPEGRPKIAQVATKFLEILQATTADPGSRQRVSRNVSNLSAKHGADGQIV